MTDRELLQQALDALEKHVYEYETIQALHTRLAQPEPEPVAWIYGVGDYAEVRWTKDGSGSAIRTPLYLAPPKKEWVGLTEDEAQYLFRLCLGRTYDDFWRAIEAKLKEKNHGNG